MVGLHDGTSRQDGHLVTNGQYRVLKSEKHCFSRKLLAGMTWTGLSGDLECIGIACSS